MRGGPPTRRPTRRGARGGIALAEGEVAVGVHEHAVEGLAVEGKREGEGHLAACRRPSRGMGVPGSVERGRGAAGDAVAAGTGANRRFIADEVEVVLRRGPGRLRRGATAICPTAKAASWRVPALGAQPPRRDSCSRCAQRASVGRPGHGPADSPDRPAACAAPAPTALASDGPEGDPGDESASAAWPSLSVDAKA